MKKTLFAAVPAACFLIVLPACSADPAPVAKVEPITAPATVEVTTEEAPVTISSDPTEEEIIQGYIRSSRQLLASGVVPRDRVTVELIQSELTYVDEDQAERIKGAILA